MIRHFPDVFKPAFVFSGQVTPVDVLKILQPRPDEGEMSENIKRVWKYVQLFVEAADSDGNVYILFKQYCLMYIFRVDGLSSVYYWSTCTCGTNICYI